jgi:hypothetical protein
MTLLPSDPPGALELRPVPDPLPGETFGGGGTTSCVPKNLPMMLLSIELLAGVVGGGGTTAVDTAPAPLSSRRRSRAESADGGGAMTEGAGRLSFALRPDSRSGAETGGGTTATSFIWTRDGETSRPAAAGAGGMTLALKAGVERARSRETLADAGPITFAFKDGAERVRSRETLAAGAMMLGSRAGA